MLMQLVIKRKLTKPVDSDILNDIPQTLYSVRDLLLTNSLKITQHIARHVP